MDLVTTLIGLAFVVLTILPFVYFYFSQKNKTKKFLNSFFSLAEQHQVKVVQHDVWSNYAAIGLDPTSKKLFYYKNCGGDEQQALINLADVEKCSVINKKRLHNEDQVIDRLELVFTFRNAGLAQKTITFYSKDESMTHNGELQLVEKWRVLVISHLVARKQQAMAS